MIAAHVLPFPCGGPGLGALQDLVVSKIEATVARLARCSATPAAILNLDVRSRRQPLSGCVWITVTVHSTLNETPREARVIRASRHVPNVPEDMTVI